MSIPIGISAQHLLNAMEGITYLVAPDGTILGIGKPAWVEFANDNGAPALTPESVTGITIFDVINGASVRERYRKIHATVVGGHQPELAFSFRCDAPAVERNMRMSVSAIVEDNETVAVLYQSLLLSEKPRVPMDLFSCENLISYRKNYRDDQIVSVCSFCHCVAWPTGADTGAAGVEREWIRPEEYYTRGGKTDVVVSHGLCEECSSKIDRMTM